MEAIMKENKRKQETEPKTTKSSVNVIKGASANILLFHRPDANTVLDEIKTSDQENELMVLIKGVAEKGVGESHTCAAKVAKKNGRLYVWSRMRSSLARLYVDTASYADKPLYIIYGVGLECKKTGPQNPYISRAFARQKQMAAMIENNIISFSDLLGADTAQQPKRLAHHKTKGKNQQMQKQKN